MIKIFEKEVLFIRDTNHIIHFICSPWQFLSTRFLFTHRLGTLTRVKLSLIMLQQYPVPWSRKLAGGVEGCRGSAAQYTCIKDSVTFFLSKILGKSREAWLTPVITSSPSWPRHVAGVSVASCHSCLVPVALSQTGVCHLSSDPA